MKIIRLIHSINYFYVMHALAKAYSIESHTCVSSIPPFITLCRSAEPEIRANFERIKLGSETLQFGSRSWIGCSKKLALEIVTARERNVGQLGHGNC